MFGGRDQHTLAHQAGGIANFCHVAANGGDFKVVQIGAAEDDSRTSGCGEQTHGDRSAGMKAYARKLDGLGNGLFQVGRIGQRTSLS